MLQILRACKTHGGKYTIHTKLWSYTLKERNHFKETLIQTRYCYKEILSHKNGQVCQMLQDMNQ